MNLNERQHQAVTELQNDLLVLAGAGTGKTRVLTEKYLYLLEAKGWNPQDIVAITFTQKAAHEMRTRVRESLGAKVQSASGDALTFWQDKLNTLNRAYIGTFHGFCQRILKEFAFEAGLSPQIKILGAGEERILLNRAVERACARMVQEGTAVEKEQYVEAVLQFGLPFFMRSVSSLLPKLRESGKPVEVWIHQSTLNRSLELASDPLGHLRNTVNDLLQSNERQKLTPRGQLFLKELESHLNVLIPESTDDIRQTVISLERLLSLLPRNLGNAVRPLIDEIHEAAEKALAFYTEREFARWLPVIGRFLEVLSLEYNNAKRMDGSMDFSDLQINLRDLLKSNPGVRLECQSRYHYFMVDEFQDTNMLQLEIVGLLVGEDNHPRPHGRLFVVGDAKQSIYRFRGAQVEVVQSLSKDLKSRNGRILPLQANYRCHPAVIDGINAVFEKLFADESIDYHPLESGRSTIDRDPEIRWEILSVPEADRQVEAERMAAFIWDAVGNGTSNVEANGEQRGLRYGDIAILMRAMTDVAVYESALRRWGIPCRIAGGSGYYGLQEVQDQLHLIRLINNSQDAVSLLGLLRSPYCGWDDESIYRLAGEERDLLRHFYELERPPQNIQTNDWDRLLKLRWWVQHFLNKRGDISVAEILRTALDNLGYLEVVCAFPNADRTLANIDKLLHKAEEFSETAGRYGLGDFIDFIGELIAIEDREGEAEVTVDDNAVQILTIHAAKGLEFPFVIVADMERRLLKPEMSPIVVHHEIGLGFKVPDGRGDMLETPQRAKIRELQRIEELSEMKRVLYVALTRAKDYLVLSGIDCEKDWDGQVKSWADWIRMLVPLGSEMKEDRFIGGRPIRIIGEALPEIPQALPISPEMQFQVESAATVELTSLDEPAEILLKPFVKFPVTGLLTYVRCPRYYYQKYRRSETAGEKTSSVGRSHGAFIGQVVHRLISLNSVDPIIIERYVRQSVTAIPFNERANTEREILRLWQVYQKSSYANYLGKRLSEYEFIVPLDQYYLQGVIDQLLIGEDGQIVLVDFKTDRTAENNMESLVHAYRPQLLSYALAVRELFHRLPSRADLFFLHVGKIAEQSFTSDEIDQWQKKLTDAAVSCISSTKLEEFIPKTNCDECPEALYCAAKEGYNERLEAGG